MSPQQDVLFEVGDGLGYITLNRPQALNALSLAMVEALDGQLAQWAEDNRIKGVVIQAVAGRAFCAGGDVRALFEAKAHGDSQYLEAFYRREYTMNYRIATFPKPILAVMDGLVMGGGAGIAMHCSLQVITEETEFAMPETALGFFPDVGAGAFLNRCPGEIGMFLALTGVRLRAQGMLHAGLATHFVPRGRLGYLTPGSLTPEGLTAEGLARLSMQTTEAPLAGLRERIDACFGLATVEEIVAVLKTRGDPWGRETLAMLERASPFSLKATFTHVRNMRGKRLPEVLAADFRLSQRFVAGHDFAEGVRAQLIDRDRAPRWQPAGLAGVTSEMLAAYFAPLEGMMEWQPPLLGK